MRYAKQFGLRPADRIVSPRNSIGITKHHAIYLGTDHYGRETVAENHDTEGVRIITATEYFQNYPSISRIEVFNGNYFQRVQAVNFAQSKQGTPYDLINYNCEHYAHEVQTGQAESTQVRFGMFLALVAGLAYMLREA